MSDEPEPDDETVAWARLQSGEPEPPPPALLPCPFCGEAPRVVEDDSYGQFQIFCVCEMEPSCGGPKANRERMIATWNRRAPVAPTGDYRDDYLRERVRRKQAEAKLTASAAAREAPQPRYTSLDDGRRTPFEPYADSPRMGEPTK